MDLAAEALASLPQPMRSACEAELLRRSPPTDPERFAVVCEIAAASRTLDRVADRLGKRTHGLDEQYALALLRAAETLVHDGLDVDEFVDLQSCWYLLAYDPRYASAMESLMARARAAAEDGSLAATLLDDFTDAGTAEA